MFDQGWQKLIIAGVIASFVTAACGELLGAVPDTWRDDANLHAVHFVDKSIGWAVGDRGTAFRTSDGGETWELRPVPGDISLRSVFFLNDRSGWAAGGTTIPFTETEPGSVYKTEDAGATWSKVNVTPLPRCHFVQFFTPQDGIIAGAANASYPSGVATTIDGGKNWTPLDTGLIQNAAGWRAAAFPRKGSGAVVGMRGRRALVGSEQLLASRDASSSLRGLHAITLEDNGVGWAVGDGGSILRTSDSGLIWQEPAATLPPESRDYVDLRTVSVIGRHVRTAGQPGGVIWHSQDDGHSWQQDHVDSPLPIAALHFCTERHGCAVGAMGLILKTNDGKNWKVVKGGERRAAVLSVSKDPKSISFTSIAALSGEQGYRTVSYLPVRHDLAVGGYETPSLDLRTSDAVVAAGGNAALSEWSLPLLVPELAGDRNALVEDWTRRTEGRLQNHLVGRLVSAIRTWRPDIVVIDEPKAGDAVDELLFQAARMAVLHAADSTRYVEQQITLRPWQVKKLYARRHHVNSGDARIEGGAFLSRLGFVTADFAGDAAARVDAPRPSANRSEFFDLISLESSTTAGPFFAGIASIPGSATRRHVPLQTDSKTPEQLVRQRLIRGYAASSFDNRTQSAAILAQIDELLEGLTPDEAARQLFAIAEEQRMRAQWDLVERSYLTLVERFPSEPPARKATAWLLQYWTGAEPLWRRMQKQGTITEVVTASSESLAARISKAHQMAEQGIAASTAEQIDAAGLREDPLESSLMRGTIKIDSERSLEAETVRHSRLRALSVAKLLKQTDPAFFLTPTIQMPLATMGRDSDGSAIVSGSAQQMHAAIATAQSPRGATPSSANCRRTKTPPHLDGILSDPCWRDAKATPLSSDGAESMPNGSFSLFAYDENFFYLAASVARTANSIPPEIETAGRRHDADTRSVDRIIYTIDIDRDYATYYRFEIDARGQLADECWGDTSWNPKWFVAIDGDAERWRIEAAIPFDELAPRSAVSGQLWAVSVARILPAVGVQGWPLPSDGTARPESFGLMRFE